MQRFHNPLARGPRSRTGVLALAALAVAICASGCDDPAVDDATTVSLSTPAPNLGAARDRDVSWFYHLSKVHATDDLVTRLDRERKRLDDASTLQRGSQPHNVLASEPPRTAVPAATVGTAPASTATNPATPRPEDPLASISSDQLDPAIVLALYHIDPVVYKRLFIENYPTTAEGVQHDFGDRLVKAKLTKSGEAYPIDELARLAVSDEVAAAKLYTAAAVANGELADRYAQTIADQAKAYPDRIFPMLVRLDMSTRLATISEPAGWCRSRPDRILREIPEDPDELALQRDLRTSLGQCKAYLSGGDHRRRASRHASKPRRRVHGARKAAKA